mgnify:CR=1 FL=1
MNKITKFLIVLTLILLFLCILLNKYEEDLYNMASKVGSQVGGGELTMKEYYTLAQCMETYIGYISEKKLDVAYNMLGTTYRDYVSYNDFVEKINNKNIENMIIKDIDIITNTTFKVIGDVSGEEYYYSIIVDNQLNRFAIYPESFLTYTQIDENVSKKKLQITLIDSKVQIDNCILKFKITNNMSTVIFSINNIFCYF